MNATSAVALEVASVVSIDASCSGAIGFAGPAPSAFLVLLVLCSRICWSDPPHWRWRFHPTVVGAFNLVAVAATGSGASTVTVAPVVLLDSLLGVGSNAHQTRLLFIHLQLYARQEFFRYSASTGSVRHHAKSLDCFDRILGKRVILSVCRMARCDSGVSQHYGTNRNATQSLLPRDKCLKGPDIRIFPSLDLWPAWIARPTVSLEQFIEAWPVTKYLNYEVILAK